MKVLAAAALLMLGIARPLAAKIIHQIELRGDVRVLSADTPVRKGRLYLFHRYPDGVYMSVPAEDVLGIASTTAPDPRKTPDTVALGPTGEGQPTIDAVAAGSGASPSSYDQGYPGYYGYSGDCYGCSGPPVRPPHVRPPPPALVGPNGFPMLPGSPAPLPIGANGFPILAPPPQASPR